MQGTKCIGFDDLSASTGPKAHHRHIFGARQVLQPNSDPGHQVGTVSALPCMQANT
jgi:hypothetical protein